MACGLGKEYSGNMVTEIQLMVSLGFVLSAGEKKQIVKF